MVITQGLTRYFGSFRAVDNLSLSIDEGDVFGFIGPNGAGKTTTLRMLATILKPSHGVAKVAGMNVATRPAQVRRVIGYMPDVFGVYEDMLVYEYLNFFAAAYAITGTARDTAVDSALNLTGLIEKRNASCRSLSRGMTQRLSLARVLLHDPKLLLLDEPASGLDPRARIEFKELVLALKALGKTIIISSHILSELAEVCNSIAIVERSKLVYCGPVDGAMGQVSAQGRVFNLLLREDGTEGLGLADAREFVRGLPFVDAVREGDRPGQISIRFVPGFDEAFRVNSELVTRGYKVEAFAEQAVRLEDAFLQLTKGIVQ
ncbi:MAG: ABC transporter ATP-binding protein [Planctomycetes bacterium]|nr:ABC transporter ATP-binding protein [Planctomycetota bacterium]